MTQAIATGFPVFKDATGEPLQNGYVYIGTSGSDAVTNPLSTFWDSSLSTSAAQPLRTNGGYLQNNGAPGNIFIAEGNYSITVKDKNGILVYANTVSPTPVDVQDGNIDSESATSGQVLTADGSGNATWSNAAAGVTNLSVTTFASTVDVDSDTGTDATLPAATASKAGVLTSTDKTKLDTIETSATADQSDAEIETAYNAQVAEVSQVDAEAGTSTTVYRWTPERVKQAAQAFGISETVAQNATNLTNLAGVTSENVIVTIDNTDNTAYGCEIVCKFAKSHAGFIGQGDITFKRAPGSSTWRYIGMFYASQVGVGIDTGAGKVATFSTDTSSVTLTNTSGNCTLTFAFTNGANANTAYVGALVTVYQ